MPDSIDKCPLGVSRDTVSGLWYEFVNQLYWQPRISCCVEHFRRLLILLRDRAGTFVFVCIFTDALYWPFIKLSIEGRDRLPRSGQVLGLATHRGYWGTFAIQGKAFSPWLLWRQWMQPINIAKAHHFPKWLQSLGEHYGVHALPGPDDRVGRKKIYRLLVRAFEYEDVAVVLFPTGKRDRPDQHNVDPFLPRIGTLIVEARPERIIFIHDDDTSVLSLARIPFWRRPQARTTYSFPLTLSDPQSELRALCDQEGDLEEVGKMVTQYVHDLFVHWVVTVDPTVESTDMLYTYPQQCWHDLQVLLNGDA